MAPRNTKVAKKAKRTKVTRSKASKKTKVAKPKSAAKTSQPGQRFFERQVIDRFETLKVLLVNYNLELMTSSELLLLLKDTDDIDKFVAKFRGFCGHTVGELYRDVSIRYVVTSHESMRTRFSFFERKPDSEAIFLFHNTEPVGFLIMRRGDCRKRPQSMVLTLVCAIQMPGVPLGSMLLAMAVFCALQAGEPEILLEVANGRGGNWTAACAYEKFGFKLTPSIANCFSSGDPDRPMSLSLKDVNVGMLERLITDKTFEGLESQQCHMWRFTRQLSPEYAKDALENPIQRNSVTEKILNQANITQMPRAEAEMTIEQQLRFLIQQRSTT
jgi:hypothetical protein